MLRFGNRTTEMNGVHWRWQFGVRLMLAEYSPCNQRYLAASPMTHNNPLIERLDWFVTLGREECEVIASLTKTRRIARASETLCHEGIQPSGIYLIVSGVGFRYRYLPNGRRQILGYLLPGDLCDTQFVILNECDHNVGLLCDSEVAMISPSVLMSAMVQYPKIERALLMTSLVEAAMMREWLLNVGQRDACQKLAHFFCEISARINSLANRRVAQGYDIPLTQLDLADTMGLTVVHVNRVLQQFRRDGLINWSRRHFEILNNERLEQIAGFDPSYLRIGNARVEPRLCAYG